MSPMDLSDLIPTKKKLEGMPLDELWLGFVAHQDAETGEVLFHVPATPCAQCERLRALKVLVSFAQMLDAFDDAHDTWAYGVACANERERELSLRTKTRRTRSPSKRRKH